MMDKTSGASDKRSRLSGKLCDSINEERKGNDTFRRKRTRGRRPRAEVRGLVFQPYHQCANGVRMDR